MKKLPPSVKVSLIALILINLASVLGIIFLKWNSGFILLSYWLESLVVGFYTVLKMRKARKIGDVKAHIGSKSVKPEKYFLIPFFIIHYGIFMFGHLAFLLVIVSINSNINSVTDTIIWLPIFFIALLLSHGISYRQNFIGNKEYENKDVSQIMMSPYARIIPMHIAILVGFMLGSPAILLVLIKTVIDVFSHIKEREKYGAVIKNISFSG